MNYSNKVIKYIGKINYVGGSSKSDDAADLRGHGLTLADLADFGGVGGGGGIEPRYKGYIVNGHNGRELIWLGLNWVVYDGNAIIYCAENQHNFVCSKDRDQPNVVLRAPAQASNYVLRPGDGEVNALERLSLDRLVRELKEPTVAREMPMKKDWVAREMPMEEPMVAREMPMGEREEHMVVVALERPRQYAFQKVGNEFVGFQKLMAVIQTEINKLEDPQSEKLDFTGVKSDDKQKFSNMMNVLRHETLYPKLNNIWPALYEHIIQDSNVYYTEKYNPASDKKYGLDILKSIYDQIKTEVKIEEGKVKIKPKFKDGDDLCMLGYSPHTKRLCQNFNGESLADLQRINGPKFELLHWPDKACPDDNDPVRPSPGRRRDGLGNYLKKDGTITINVNEAEVLPPNPFGGCSLHRSSRSCTQLHENTVLQCDGLGKGVKEDCRQIQFQLLARNRKRNVPPVVSYKGFQTLPYNGKWAQISAFTNMAGFEKFCNFKEGDLVKLRLYSDVVESRFSIPKYNKRWVSQITKLNFNDEECTSARVKFGVIQSAQFTAVEEARGVPVENNVDVTRPEDRAVGLTSLVYFRTIDVKLLRYPNEFDLEQEEVKPVRVPVPAHVPNEEEIAYDKINADLATFRKLTAEYIREKERYDIYKHIDTKLGEFRKTLKNMKKLSKRDGDPADLSDIIRIFGENITLLESKRNEIPILKLSRGVKLLTEIIADIDKKLKDPLISKLELSRTLYVRTDENQFLKQLETLPEFLRERRLIVIDLLEFVGNLIKILEGNREEFKRRWKAIHARDKNEDENEDENKDDESSGSSSK